MKIEKYIDKIVKNGTNEQMEELSDMLEDLIYKMKDYDEDCYNEYKNELFGMAYNYKFDEETAKEVVENFMPLGEVWDLDTTTQVKRQYGVNADDIEFYVVMNDMANNYANDFSTDDVATYVKLAKGFLNDADAVKKKFWIYYTKIAK